ncbi:MAG: hypothetical protein EXR93_05265 [Gemmatimonadetes bacterium]|nr:hypothetical protein [Gemmatimonadota bacterium]
MIHPAVLLVALCAFTTPATAQLRIGLRAGVTGSSALVTDSIVQRISARTAPAPNLGFTLENDLDSLWRVALGFSTSWAHLSRHSGDSSEVIVPLTVWTPTLSLSRVMLRSIVARASIGAIAYDPDHTDGNLFSGGAPILPLVGFGLGTERTAGNGLRMIIELAYDLHRFTTTKLRDDGFSGAQSVHRLTLSLTLSRIAVN